jgi:hypothetical protein
MKFVRFLALYSVLAVVVAFTKIELWVLVHNGSWPRFVVVLICFAAIFLIVALKRRLMRREVEPAAQLDEAPKRQSDPPLALTLSGQARTPVFGKRGL